VCEQDLEGIVAKPVASRYAVNGVPVWLKIKNPAYTGALGRWERFERGRRP
jgi:ATP-dependent DNA ligase